MAEEECSFLYRGFSSAVVEGVVQNQYLSDERRPRNTDFENHERANSWFEKKFGRRYRTRAWFGTGSPLIAGSYGLVYGFEPTNHSNSYCCWSPAIADMFNALIAGQKRHMEIERILDEGLYEEFPWSDCERRWKAIKSGNEVMVFSQEFRVFRTAARNNPL